MEVRDDAGRVLLRYYAIRRPINLAQEGLRYDDDAAPPHCLATGPAADGGGRDRLVPGRAGLRACGPRRPACRGLTAQTCRGYYHRGSCKSARQAGTNPKGSHASMGSQFSLGPLRK